MPSIFRRLSLGSCAGAALLALAAPVAAQAQGQTVAFDIPAQDLAAALRAFARQSGQQVIFDGAAARGKTSQALKGGFPVEPGLDLLLRGSGLSVKRGARGVLMVGEGAGPQAVAAAASAEPAELSEVLITGSRIRGAPQASPVIVLTDTDIRNAGQHDLGEVVRSLPQNFGGGSNPGTGSRNGVTGGNFGGASTINLRGIGRDATLTLLNGHRLSANANGGVDITAIPLLALQRLEIITDGASALYGSDAVGGVANFITKRAYSGLNVTALYGGSTDGGYEQKQLSAVSGKEWNGGGLIAAVTNARSSKIAAGQRSYTTGMNPEATLFPKQNRTNVFSSAYQEVGSGVTLSVDGLYSYNRSLNFVPFLPTASVMTSGNESHTQTRSYSLTPTITANLPHDWLLNAYGSIGRDRAKYVLTTRTNGVPATSNYCYCNGFKSAEMNISGDAVNLPAGRVKLALGGGYRAEKAAFNQTGSTNTYAETQVITYGFGELAIPLISPGQDVPFIQALNLNAAVRYEDYEGGRSIATPKLGLIYNVDSDFTLKASWGKSFKAASFNQRYSIVNASLNPVAGYGNLFPADATFITISGGRPDLAPEKATSFTSAISYHPRKVPGLEASLGYYRINFRDRVVQPFTSTAGALTNALYSSYIVRNPSVGTQSAALSRTPLPLVNRVPGPYDPSKVIAIIDISLTNATEQKIDGFDLSLKYRRALSNGSDLTLFSSSTYLDIRQQLIPNVAPVGLAGNFYFPRHFMSRSGASWTDGDLTISGFINYTGAARYRAVTPIQDIKAVTTLDLTARLTVPQLSGTEIAISAINVLNAQPTVVPGTSSSRESSFDAANYAVTGRLLTLSVSKSF